MENVECLPHERWAKQGGSRIDTVAFRAVKEAASSPGEKSDALLFLLLLGEKGKAEAHPNTSLSNSTNAS